MTTIGNDADKKIVNINGDLIMNQIKIENMNQIKPIAIELTRLWNDSIRLDDFKNKLSIVDVYNLMVIQTFEQGRSFEDSIDNANCHMNKDSGMTYLRYFTCYK